MELTEIIQGESDGKPDIYSVCEKILSAQGTSTAQLEFTDYHEGNFYAELILENGTRYELRTSDAIQLALVLEAQMYASEDVIRSAAVHINSQSLLQLFGVSVSDDHPDTDSFEANSASGDSVKDEDFEQFMRDLGAGDLDVNDTDFNGEEERENDG